MSDSNRKSDTQVREQDSLGTSSKFSLFNHRWLTSLLVVTLFVTACVAIVGPPYYETSDDLTMEAIVSGVGFLNRPDEHLLFSHVYLGLLLKQLYSALPAVPWYGIYQTVTLCIALSAITWVVLGKSRRPIMMIGIAVGALLVTAVRPLLMMQFTYTGAVLAAAGVLLLIECVDRFHLRKRAVACGVGAAIMFVLASLVRGSSATLVLMVAAIFITAQFLPVAIRQWRRMLAQLLAVGAAFALVTGLTWLNDRYYTGEWKEYYPRVMATNAIREYRCCYFTSPLSLSIYKRVGWKDADATLFLNWYSLDKEVHSIDKLKTVAKLMKDYWKENFDSGRALWVVNTIMKDPAFLPVVLPLLLLVPFINRTKVSFASMFLLTIGILVLSAFSIVWLKLPMRVFASMILPCMLLGIRYLSVSKIAKIFQSTPDSSKLRRTIYATILLAVIAPSFFVMSQLHSNAVAMSKQQRKFNEALAALSPKPDQVYVRWGASLPLACIGPFSNLAKTFHNFKLIPVGAMGQAPFVMNRLKEFGIEDVMRQLDKENVYLISNAYFNRFIQIYAAEKFEKEVVFTPVRFKPQYCQVFKVKFVTPANLEKFKKEWAVGVIASWF